MSGALIMNKKPRVLIQIIIYRFPRRYILNQENHKCNKTPYVRTNNNLV